MKMVIPFRDGELCRAILSSIEPDNRTAPPSIEIRCECCNEVLVAEISSESSVLTFRNTVDDLLEHVAIAWRSIEAAARSREHSRVMHD